MEKVIAFVLENWKLIAFVLCLIAELVVFLVRKKPIKVVDSVKEEIFGLLVAAIGSAEEVFGQGHGVEKKELVLKAVKNHLEITHPEIDFANYEKLASEMVEFILSTPQKKGEK